MSQLDLLARATVPVTPAPGQDGPRLWVRRLAIWRTRDDVQPVRDISLVPGFNIIWSPDPTETPSAEEEEPTALGHGGGKTLFCRLLRYCLGEDRYATHALTERVRAKFPDGVVGAVVVVDGVDWSVVRPIGFLGRHVAVREVELDEVVRRDAHDTGIKLFIDAMATAFIGSHAASLIADGTSRTAWLTALAWLTRDQECRFDDVLDWRAAASGSESPVRARDIGKSDRLHFLRVLISAIAPEEQEAARIRAVAKSRRDEAETTTRHHQWDVTHRRAALVRALGLEEARVPPGPLALEALRQAARAAIGVVSLPAGPERAPDELEAERDATALTLAQVTADIRALEREIPKAEGRLRMLRGEHVGIGLELRETEVHACEVCEVPIDEALAEGCKISLDRDPVQLAEVRARRERTAGEIHKLSDELTADCERLAELKDVVEPARQRELKSIAAALMDVRSAQNDRTKAWDNERAVRDLAGAYAQRDAAKAEFDRLDKEFQEQGEGIASMRGEQAALFQALSGRFDETIGQLAQGASGSVKISGHGLVPSVEFGGDWTSTAIESLKVLAFDLAVMILSMEGKTRLPAFLVHDSPREADLGLAAYHTLFRYAQSLEKIGSMPSFQYIVTTTTQPPEDMQQEPWLRCKLQSAPPARRLLTENL